MDEEPTLSREIPPLDDYLRLREICGLTPRDRASAEAGLPNSWAAVTARDAGGAVVGMGRVTGDGALFLTVVDIAVDPAQQGRGLGGRIMAALMEEVRARVPGRCHVSLMADGEAHRLYARFGFEPVAPRSQGMARWVEGRAHSPS